MGQENLEILSNFRMGLSTMASGIKNLTIEMGKEFKYGLMEADTKDIGRMEKPMGRED